MTEDRAVNDANSFAADVTAFLGVGSDSVASIGNLSTTVGSIGEGEGRLPVTVNCSEPENAWVCSPYTTYVRYADDELRRIGPRWLSRPLGSLCTAMGGYLMRARIDDAVIVNNWLLSTNLYPSVVPTAATRYLDEAVSRWPDHAIWFRSLNARQTGRWLDAVRRAGCLLVPSRLVYLYDRIDADAVRPANLRRDLRLHRSTTLETAPATHWAAVDFERAAHLYDLLYLRKYSHLNPAYSAAFLRTWHVAGLLRLLGYRAADGTLQVVVGTFGSGDTVTAPIVGYDTHRPQREGLYRLAIGAVYAQAAARGQQINLSAGAGHFKRLRGGVGIIEYSAVYTRHLARPRQRAIAMLAQLAHRIGEPFMRRFQP